VPVRAENPVSPRYCAGLTAASVSVAGTERCFDLDTVDLAVFEGFLTDFDATLKAHSGVQTVQRDRAVTAMTDPELNSMV
jgi:hypothetical protein